jgi:hypothetical protein
MTGFASKRQSAWDKFAKPWNGIAGWEEIGKNMKNDEDDEFARIEMEQRMRETLAQPAQEPVALSMKITDTNVGLSWTAQEPVGGCVCRWDSEGDRVVTCERHEGWLKVVAEWADRARDAEKKLKALAQPAQEPVNEAAIRADEREACALIVEDMNSLMSPEIAAAIRARGNT